MKVFIIDSMTIDKALSHQKRNVLPSADHQLLALLARIRIANQRRSLL